MVACVCVYSIKNYVHSFCYTPYGNRFLLVSSSVVFFASQPQSKESSFPLLDIPDEMLTPDQLEVKKRQRILRSAQQGRARAQALQRERRQKVRVRETTEGQGQRDDRRSGSER